MKRGELIILWIGGLLSTILLVVQGLNAPRIPSEIDRPFVSTGTIAGHIVETAFILLAIWIICGLVWASIYRRKP